MRRRWLKTQHIPVWVIWMLILFCSCLVDNVYGETSQKGMPVVSEYRNTTPGSPIWTPDAGLPDRFDWIQLTSDEWLKGELKVLYEDKLEFESDELDLLEFDWEDIRQVRCHKLKSIRFEGPVTVIGILKIVDDRVFITNREGVREFERSRLVSIASGELEEINYWSAKVSVSADIRKGNSDQVDYSSSARAQRRTIDSRFFIDFRGIYTQTEGTETASSHRSSSYFDVFKTRNLFLRPIFGEYYRDPFSNIKYSITAGSGVGYHIINTTKTNFLFSPGLAYVYTENVSAETGEDTTNSTPALAVATEFTSELTKRTDFNAQYRFNVVNRESGRYTHHASAVLEFELTNRLDLDLSFVWDRIQEPKTEADGRVPDQDDFYFFCGVGFEL